MKPILSRAGIRAFEARVIDAGVPELVLMENAGRGAAHLIGLHVKPRHGNATKVAATRGSCVRCADEGALVGASILVLAGPGKNGGDGFVVGRHLSARGAKVRTVELPSRLEPVRTMRGAFVAIGGEVIDATDTTEAARVDAAFVEADWIVDALFGIGASRPLDGVAAALVERANASGRPIVALDVPSGLDADTGAAPGPVVRARHTVTFAHLKAGLLTTNGHTFGGRITVSQIGVPRALEPTTEIVGQLAEESDLVARLTPRDVAIHKNRAGRVVVVAGAPGTIGAARLATHAAFRAGAGVVTLASTRETIDRFERESVETMTRVVGDESEEDELTFFGSASSLVVGPGLGQSALAREIVLRALRAKRPTVLDADGVRLSLGSRELREHGSAILTPHAGEAAFLLGSTVQEVENDRFGAARRLVEATGAVVVLKGSRTLVAAPGRVPWVSAWGSSALATAGSGDVLAGVIGALLAEPGSRDPFDAALLGVGLHALAAEAWSEKNGDAGLLASELSDSIPEVRARLVAMGSSVV